MNISSIVVSYNPDKLEVVKANIIAIENCEFHVADESGRMVITIESTGVDEEMKILDEYKLWNM